MSEPIEAKKHAPNRCRSGFIIPLSLGIVLALAVWWLWTPSYLELTIPVTPNATGYFWWEEHRSTLEYADEPGSLYLFRRVGTGYADQQGWPSQDAAMRHFHDWLTARGWGERDIYTGGDPIAPETRLLQYGDEFRVYTQDGDDWGNGSRVVVAIIPIPEVNGYEVSVTTATPSWLRQLSDAFDD